MKFYISSIFVRSSNTHVNFIITRSLSTNQQHLELNVQKFLKISSKMTNAFMVICIWLIRNGLPFIIKLIYNAGIFLCKLQAVAEGVSVYFSVHIASN